MESRSENQRSLGFNSTKNKNVINRKVEQYSWKEQEAHRRQKEKEKKLKEKEALNIRAELESKETKFKKEIGPTWDIFYREDGKLIDHYKEFRSYDHNTLISDTPNKVIFDGIWKDLMKSDSFSEVRKTKAEINYLSFNKEYSRGIMIPTLFILYDKQDVSAQFCSFGLVLHTLRRIKKGRRSSCAITESSLIFRKLSFIVDDKDKGSKYKLKKIVYFVMMYCPFSIHKPSETDFFPYKYGINILSDVTEDKSIVYVSLQPDEPQFNKFRTILRKMFRPDDGNTHGYDHLIIRNEDQRNISIIFPHYLPTLHLMKIAKDWNMRHRLILLPKGDSLFLESHVRSLTAHCVALHNLRDDLPFEEATKVLKDLSSYGFENYIKDAAYIWPFLWMHALKKIFSMRTAWPVLLRHIFIAYLGCEIKPIQQIILDMIYVEVWRSFIEFGFLRDRVATKSDQGWYTHEFMIKNKNLVVPINLHDDFDSDKGKWFNSKVVENDGFSTYYKGHEDQALTETWFVSNYLNFSEEILEYLSVMGKWKNVYTRYVCSCINGFPDQLKDTAGLRQRHEWKQTNFNKNDFSYAKLGFHYFDVLSEREKQLVMSQVHPKYWPCFTFVRKFKDTDWLL